MSHTSSTSNQEVHKCTSNVFTSTPVDDVLANITFLSKIGISSLSGDRTEDKLQSQTTRKKIKKRKELSKKTKIPYKKRIIQLNDIEQKTSTEWSTESEEEVVNEDVLEDDSINLFDNPCTPEKIRDAPITYESPVHRSPILRSSNRFLAASERYSVAHHKLLPVNIPFEKRMETDEDKIILNRTDNVKTYKRPKDKEKNLQCSLPIYWSAIPCVPPCFSMSDLLWEQFVKENREEMPEYLASCSARVMYKESEFLRKHPDIPPKFEDESSSYPPGTICIRGHSDSNTREWVTKIYYTNKEKKVQTKIKGHKRNKRNQKNIMLESLNETVYDIEDERDVEFETGGRNGGRITLSEFRQKCKY